MIISKTPVRISFFGGGTDYPIYYHRNKGAVFGTTINKYIFISLNRLEHFFDHRIRLSYSKLEKVNHVHEIQHPSIRCCLEHRQIDEGMNIHIFADLPARTGLGSSSALTAGFLKVLSEYNNASITKRELAYEALYVEQKLLKEKVGSQDQFHAAYGGLNIITFDKEDIQVIPLSLDSEKQELLSSSCMLFFTGIKRYAEDILNEQIDKTASSSNDVHLEELYEMVFEGQRILSDYDGEIMIQKFGQLLNYAWSLKQKLSSQISNPEINSIYQKALSAGAYGGKLCGAGKGGFLLLVVPLALQSQVRKALSSLVEVSFTFEDQGSTILPLSSDVVTKVEI